MVYLLARLALRIGYHKVVHRLLVLGVLRPNHRLRTDLFVGVNHLVLGLVHGLNSAHSDVAYRRLINAGGVVLLFLRLTKYL